MLIKGRGKKLICLSLYLYVTQLYHNLLIVAVSISVIPVNFILSLAKTENYQQAEVTLISSRSPSTGLLSQANACVEIKYDGRRRGAVMLWHAATTH